jgi:hypothetical protein
LRLSNFGRGVAFPAHAGVDFAHTFTVIDDLDEGASPVLNQQFDLVSAGINAVFEQFFDRA